MMTADPFRVRPLTDVEVARLDAAALVPDEQRCLGAAMIDNVILGGALAGLSPHHFSVPAHQELFALMLEYDAAGLRFDCERLRQALQQRKRLQAIGDAAYLQQLLQHGRHSLCNVGANARLLMRKAAIGVGGNKQQAASNKLEPQAAALGQQVPVKLITLAEVEAKPVDWIWEPYLPCGAVAVLSGDPGVGKSYLALAIAANAATSNKQQVTSQNTETQKPVVSGQWSVVSEDKTKPETPQLPTENWEPRTENFSADVLYVGANDSPEHVMRPRFEALGGDAERLHLLEASFQLPVSSFQSDGNVGTKPNSQPNRKLEAGNRKLIPLLAAALQQTRARLVIVDPLESCLAAEGIGPRSQKFRRWLDQLAGLAAAYHCCVLLVRTLSRTPSGRATAGALGSIELAGAVRSHLVAGVSADNPGERALVQVKSNWGRLGPPLGYSIDEAGRFSWTGPSTLTLEQILAAVPDDEQKSALQEAEHFLKTTLVAGAEPAATVQREAHNLGIAGVTLRRAKRRLGVLSKKCGGGPWQWVMQQEADVGSRPSAVDEKAATSNEAVVSGQWLVASEDKTKTENPPRPTENRELGTEKEVASQNNNQPDAPQFSTENRELRTENLSQASFPSDSREPMADGKDDDHLDHLPPAGSWAPLPADDRRPTADGQWMMLAE
jgi:hypothetical protein